MDRTHKIEFHALSLDNQGIEWRHVGRRLWQSVDVHHRDGGHLKFQEDIWSELVFVVFSGYIESTEYGSITINMDQCPWSEGQVVQILEAINQHLNECGWIEFDQEPYIGADGWCFGKPLLPASVDRVIPTATR